MLSRIAESLYWLGRHVERADCTARILDTYLHLLPSGPARGDSKAIIGLVTAMGLGPADRGVGTEQLVRSLVFDGELGSSVAGALIAARDNARGVRDVVPLDVWECLNVTWHGLRTRANTGAGPHAFLRWVAERTAMANGLVDHVMNHDEGWHFLAVGRALERADMTIRLLAGVDAGPGSLPPWRALVSATGGWEPYVRAHGGAIGHRTASEFVLLDQQFPRSIIRSMTTAENLLAALESAGAAGGQDPRRDPSSARRIVGRARTGLEYRTGADEEELGSVLTGLQRAIGGTHVAITKSFFRQGDAVTWANQSSTGGTA